MPAAKSPRESRPLSRPESGCSVQDKPEPAGWQRLSRQIFPTEVSGALVRWARALRGLLELDQGARFLELGLGLLGVFLGGLLDDRLRGAVDEVLGLLQTQAGELAHHLDHLDLL